MKSIGHKHSTQEPLTLRKKRAHKSKGKEQIMYVLDRRKEMEEKEDTMEG